jgi:hypothetical protein
VFVARPPLFRVDAPARGKKPASKAYALDEGELTAILDKLRKENVREGAWSISRFKGLGEMNAEQLWDTTLNPDTRRLLPVQLGTMDFMQTEPPDHQAHGQGRGRGPARADGTARRRGRDRHLSHLTMPRLFFSSISRSFWPHPGVDGSCRCYCFSVPRRGRRLGLHRRNRRGALCARARSMRATSCSSAAQPARRPADAAAGTARAVAVPTAQPKLVAFFEVAPGFRSVKHLLREASAHHDVDYELLKALIATESGFDAGAVSPKGAIGLMQVMPATAARYGVSADRNAPASSRSWPTPPSTSAPARAT